MDDCIVCVLRNGFTAHEKTIADGGDMGRLIEMRQDFQRLMERRYRETIESHHPRDLLPRPADEQRRRARAQPPRGTDHGGPVTYNRMVVGELTDDEVDRLFHALADATRRDILRRCVRGEPSVSRLADVYPMSFAAVQKHVAVLERAGLVTKERRGREQLVRTDPDAVGRARQVLDELETAWRGRVDRMADLLASLPEARRMSVVSVEKDFDSLSLTLVADFDAPIERVWQLWADPRQLERWWGPPTHPATVEKHDLAAGGEVTYVMTGPEGEQSRGWWRVTRSTRPGRSSSPTDSPTGTGRRTPRRRPPRCRCGSPSTTAAPAWSCASSSTPASTWSGWSAGARSTVFPQSVGQMDALLAPSDDNPAQEAC